MPGRCNSGTVYSGLLLLSGFLVTFITQGLEFCSGVFFVIILDIFSDDNSAVAALAPSLMSALLHAVGPIAGVLINRFGCRTVGMLGGAVSGMGLVLSVWVLNIYYVCLMFGGVCGVGVGLSYMSAVISITNHFTKHRAVAFTFTSVAVGLGIFVYPFLIRYLNNEYGWRGSLLMHAAIAFNMMVCSAIIRDKRRKPKTVNSTDSSSTPDKAGVINLHIFLNRDYAILCISNVFVRMGMWVIYVHLAAYAETRGINKDAAARLFSTIGIANMFGKMMFAGIVLIPRCNGIHIYILGNISAGIAAVLIGCSKSYLILHILAAVYGLSLGCNALANVEMCVQFLGQDLTANGFGNLMLFYACGYIIGGPLGSLIYNGTGIYSNSIYFGGGMFICGTLLLVIPLISRSNKPVDKETPAKTNSISEEQL